MTATTSIRRAAKRRLIDLLASQPTLTGVPGDTGSPGGQMKTEHYWIGTVTGPMSDPLMKAGRRIRDDEFTMTVVFRVDLPGGTQDEADERAEELWSGLDELLAEDRKLDGLEGVLWAVLGQKEGPDGELTDEGAISAISQEVTVKARYQ